MNYDHVLGIFIFGGSSEVKATKLNGFFIGHNEFVMHN